MLLKIAELFSVILCEQGVRLLKCLLINKIQPLKSIRGSKGQDERKDSRGGTEDREMVAPREHSLGPP